MIAPMALFAVSLATTHPAAYPASLAHTLFTYGSCAIARGQCNTIFGTACRGRYIQLNAHRIAPRATATAQHHVKKDRRCHKTTTVISISLRSRLRASYPGPVLPGSYILVGAETPMSDSTSFSTERTASQAARRARVSSGSTGRPSLGSTWQAA